VKHLETIDTEISNPGADTIEGTAGGMEMNDRKGSTRSRRCRALIVAGAVVLVLGGTSWIKLVRPQYVTYTMHNAFDHHTALCLTVPADWEVELGVDDSIVRPRPSAGPRAWIDEHLLRISASDRIRSGIQISWYHRPVGQDVDEDELSNQQYWQYLFGASHVSMRQSACGLGRLLEVDLAGLPSSGPSEILRNISVFPRANFGTPKDRIDVICSPSENLRRATFQEVDDIVSRLRFMHVSSRKQDRLGL
jgi:hypothetical protein